MALQVPVVPLLTNLQSFHSNRLPAELIFESTEAYDGDKITSYGRYIDSLRSRIQYAQEEERD